MSKPETLSPKDISGTNSDDWTDAVEIAGGYSVRIEITYDQDHGAPWEECDGHGPVSEWTTRDKAPGERILASDGRSKRYYDIQAATALAKKDGWGAHGDDALTGGAKAACAVEADFEYLRKWCNDEWHYVVVGVEVSRDGEVLADGPDYCGGIEDCGDYWKEHACQVANYTIAADRRERKAQAIAARIEKREANYWLARGIVTI